MVSIRDCTNEILYVIFGLAIQEGGSGYALDLALACHHFEPIGLYHTYESLCVTGSGLGAPQEFIQVAS